jgi:hypothetical protein
MRPVLLAPLLLVISAPAFADDLPPGVDSLLTCGHVYSMKSEDAKAAGDEGGATEFFHMGDNLIWQARTTLEGAGYAADAVENVVMNNSLITGFRYGAGEADTMFEECLAAADSP